MNGVVSSVVAYLLRAGSRIVVFLRWGGGERESEGEEAVEGGV